MFKSLLGLFAILLDAAFARNVEVLTIPDLSNKYTPQTISVGGGVVLSYIDSGAVMNSSSYTTIFAIHGEAYYSPVFARVMTLAPASDVRFVAINRRDYPGSSPYNPSELTVLANGTDGERTEFLQNRGIEIATFIEIFMREQNTPPLSSDGKSGGISLLGWSLGNSFSLAAISSSSVLPAEVRQRLGANMRSLIMQEPPSIAIGTPIPPQSWSPQIDSSIPVSYQQPLFVQWITSYFQHGNLSTRNPEVLQYVLPATFRTPSVFKMTPSQLTDMTDVVPAYGSDTTFMENLGAELSASYKNALFNASIRASFPEMKVWEYTGDITASFGIAAYWSIQDDDTTVGGGFVKFGLIQGTNHFMHWDDPEIAISAYVQSFA